MTEKAESSMRNKLISKDTVVPLSALIIVVVVVWNFFAVRMNAAEARQGVQKNETRVEACRSEIESLKQINAGNEQRLKNIEKMLDKIDKKLP